MNQSFWSDTLAPSQLGGLVRRHPSRGRRRDNTAAEDGVAPAGQATGFWALALCLHCCVCFVLCAFCGWDPLRQETGRHLRILAKYEETCSFFGPFRVLTARWSKKKKKESLPGAHPHFSGFFPVLPRLH